MRFLSSFDTIKGYVKLEQPLKVMLGLNSGSKCEYEIVGYFPYSVATIKNTCVKIPRSFAKDIISTLNTKRLMDNKIVVICKDLVLFGTHDFAVQIHDSGCRIGSLDDVLMYDGTGLVSKKEPLFKQK